MPRHDRGSTLIPRAGADPARLAQARMKAGSRPDIFESPTFGQARALDRYFLPRVYGIFALQRPTNECLAA